MKIMAPAALGPGFTVCRARANNIGSVLLFTVILRDRTEFLTHVSKEETEGQGGPVSQWKSSRAGLNPGVTPGPVLSNLLSSYHLLI